MSLFGDKSLNNSSILLIQIFLPLKKGHNIVLQKFLFGQIKVV